MRAGTGLWGTGISEAAYCPSHFPPAPKGGDHWLLSERNRVLRLEADLSWGFGLQVSGAMFSP